MPPADDRRADERLQELEWRGAPSHDGTASRVARWTATSADLVLELQPVRWAARLLEAKHGSIAVICIARRTDGCWLAGRRSAWLGVWPGEWMLGAAGGIDVEEDPVVALERELREEWGITPASLAVAGLVETDDSTVWLVGLATLDEASAPCPNDEHDQWAWWPADPRDWPVDVRPDVKEVADMVSAHTAPETGLTSRR